MKLQVSLFALCGLIVSAESDETLLLQTHATRKSDPVEAEKKDIGYQLLKSMNMSNPGEMSLLVADSAALAVKTDVHLDDATKQALEAMKTSLTEESQEYIKAAYKTDQDLLNSESAALEGCVSTYATNSAEDGELLATVTDKGATHTACRGVQDGTLGDKTTKCDALTSFVAGVSACPSVPGPDGMEAFFVSVGGIFALQGTWQTLDSECKSARTADDAKDAECDTAQEEYESDFCTLRLQMHQTCATYKTCYTASNAAFGEAMNSVEQNDGARKVEWTAIEKIKCYIEVLISDAENDERQTALGNCKELDPDTSHLDITYPPTQDEKQCDLSAVASPPCSPEFETGYASLNADLLKACVPCADLPAHLKNPGGVSEQKNLALGRPTTQGPGMWSTFESKYCVDGSSRDDNGGLTPCGYDAHGETTQEGSCQSVCHTGHGHNAYWQVELAEPSLVEEVRVINAWTHCCKERIIPFHIYLLDSAGSTIASKGFTQVHDEFVWEAANTPNVQKVKVMLDGSNYLHMAEVFVMGRTVVAGESVPPAPAIPALPEDGICPPFSSAIMDAAEWKWGGTNLDGLGDCYDICKAIGKVCNERSEELQTLICSQEALDAFWPIHPQSISNPGGSTDPTWGTWNGGCHGDFEVAKMTAPISIGNAGAHLYFFCAKDVPQGARSTCGPPKYYHHNQLCACQES